MKLFAFTLLFLFSFEVCAQKFTCDHSSFQTSSSSFKAQYLILPAFLIGFGALGLKNQSLRNFNLQIREEITEHRFKKVKFDDYLQLVPMVSVYGLNLAGIKGESSLSDKTILLAISSTLMTSTVRGLKKATGVQRPDGRANNSFPSGHTATAFTGAEFMYQEYKNVSIWYGLSGYFLATGTGLFRMYNNRHWFTDVCAGAGIGILSTKISYWVYPAIKNKILKVRHPEYNIPVIEPFYDGKQTGVNIVVNF